VAINGASQPSRRWLVRVLAVALVAGAGALLAGSAAGSAVRARNGEWIAYSTAHSSDHRSYYGGSGSDVFVIRAGGRPKLVAGRGDGGSWNVCPAFSPNGKMLAFGRRYAKRGFSREGSAIWVDGVTRDGTIGAPSVILWVPGGRAPCPEWSADSSRVAYLDTYGSRRIIVLGLDGSRQQWAKGDPTLEDFRRSNAELSSPTGKLVASLSDGGIVVSRPDGSDRHVIKDFPPSYAIAGWSPDGRKLVVMRDVNGGFMMRAVSVNAPFSSAQIAAYVRVNNARSWPRYGDVSWQPLPTYEGLGQTSGHLTAGTEGAAEHAGIAGGNPSGEPIDLT